MSSADRNDPNPFTLDEAKAVIAFPIVDRYMRRPFSINARDWDIPYLAGYSVDGRIIFIDRDLGNWMFQGQKRLTSPFLTLHEHVEKSALDALAELAAQRETQRKMFERLLILLKMAESDVDDPVKRYYHTHGVATAAEEYAVSMQFGRDGTDSYNAFMQGQIKRAGDERIRRVPRVLDMTPYQGHDARDVLLRHEMEARMVA